MSPRGNQFILDDGHTLNVRVGFGGLLEVLLGCSPENIFPAAVHTSRFLPSQVYSTIREAILVPAARLSYNHVAIIVAEGLCERSVVILSL